MFTVGKGLRSELGYIFSDMLTYPTSENGYVEKIYESEVSRTGADGKVVFGVTKVLLLKYFQI